MFTDLFGLVGPIILLIYWLIISVVYIVTVHIVFSLTDLALVAKPQVMPITKLLIHGHILLITLQCFSCRLTHDVTQGNTALIVVTYDLKQSEFHKHNDDDS